MKKYNSNIDVWTRKQATEIDNLSSIQFGIPTLSLMDEAGEAVSRYIIENLECEGGIVILCGLGNNGGDGLVAARYLIEKVRNIKVFLVGEKDSIPSPSCQYQIDSFPKEKLHRYKSGDLRKLDNKTLLVDALLGLGLKSELREGICKEALKEAATIKWNKVLAVDLPSGLRADHWGNEAILKADFTITFGARKLAHCLYPSKDSCGLVEVVEIAFSKEAIDICSKDSSSIFLDRELVRQIEPWQGLSPYAHKYDRGHVLVIGGSDGKLGAPAICASAAFHAGAGWVSVALSSGLEQLSTLAPEVTYEDFYDKGVLDLRALKKFVLTRKVKAICIGPGMMKSPFNESHWREFLELLSLVDFCVIDAGALDGLGLLLDIAPMTTRCLLTPHPKEWCRIHPDNKDIHCLDELEKAKKRIQHWGVEVFYKTASPFTIGNESACLINSEADVSVGKAGTGDLLAGIALILGVRNSTSSLGNVCQSYIAWTAKQRQKVLGFHGLSASDIAKHIASVIK